VTGPAPLDVTRQIALAEGPLEYTLRRSHRARRLRVTIDPTRGVIVTIPVRGAIRAVEAFLREREPWLRRHLRAQERQRARVAAHRTFGPDGRIPFRGELHRVRIERAEPGTKRSRVLRVGGEEIDELVLVMALADRRSAAAVLEAWLRERALAAITADIDRHAPALGVTPAAISLRDPKTRWGSASRARRLSFSWRLILAPPEALETVVVHELAHLRVFGHGPAFWAVVASRLPAHRQWRKWLQEHSLELHAALDDGGAALAVGQLTFADQLAI
jgi:predicted metal-dependent hydrolase